MNKITNKRNLFLLTTMLLALNLQVLSKDFNNKISFDTHIFLKKYEQAKVNPERKISLKNYSFQSRDSVSTAKLYIKINENYNQNELEKLDAKVLVRTKSVVLISIPINKIEKLTRLDFVEFIEISKQPRPLLERALPSSNVVPVHQGLDLERSYFGEGVIVGIIDGGFDFTHPMFSDENGNSRVKRAWLSHDESGTPPANSNLGTLFTDSSVIKNVVKYSSDFMSHATHVTGIAAGTEVAGRHFTHKGVATKSDIAVVSMEFMEGPVPTFLEGFAYLFSYADSVGKPIAINVSMGNASYGRDGMSLQDIAINEFVDANPNGKIIIVASGNESMEDVHFLATLNNNTATVSTLVQLEVQNLSFWGDANTNFEISFSIKYQGNTYEIKKFDTKQPEWVMGPIFTPWTMLLSSSAGVYQTTNRPYVDFRFFKDEEDGVDAILNITITSTDATKVHGWSEPDGKSAAFFNPSSNVVIDNFYMVSSPATADRVITVGSYNTREETQVVPGRPDLGPLGDISIFSSRGPLTNGVVKPDITAPGSQLYSAANSFDFFQREMLFEYGYIIDSTLDGQHEFFGGSGTSMASPMVTGIVALMLEINPKLTVNEIKDIIRITAINDQWTGDAKNNKSPVWGWGKIDAHAIMRNLETNSIADFDNTISFTVYPNPVVNNEITISIFDTVCDLPFVVNIYDVRGRLVFLSSMHDVKTFDISRLDAGFYILKIDNGKRRAVGKIVVGR